MANAVYPKFKEALLQASANSALTGTLKVALIDAADYTYSASHQFWSDVAGAAVVGTPQTLTSKTYVGGVLDADDATIPSVTGDQSEALILYLDTGSAATSRLVAYMDTGITGLPVTPNGGDINIGWNASGIIQF